LECGDLSALWFSAAKSIGEPARAMPVMMWLGGYGWPEKKADPAATAAGTDSFAKLGS